MISLNRTPESNKVIRKNKFLIHFLLSRLLDLASSPEFFSHFINWNRYCLKTVYWIIFNVDCYFPSLFLQHSLLLFARFLSFFNFHVTYSLLWVSALLMADRMGN